MREQSGNTGRKAILVASFGTSYNDSRERTIGAIEQTIGEAYPEHEVRRAFTSQMIINKVKNRDGLVIDNVKEALERAAADGVQKLIVQPTHVMAGFEYQKLVSEVSAYRDRFDRVALSRPLLDRDPDFHALIQAITEETKEYDDGETAICFMGHGTEAESNDVYEKLQKMLWNEGYKHYFVGTVEALPDLEQIAGAVRQKGHYRRMVLQPLMVVAGDHANHDMAGDQEDSWKNVLTRAGYQVTCILRGLGELPAVRRIYVSHVRDAMQD